MLVNPVNPTVLGLQRLSTMSTDAALCQSRLPVVTIIGAFAPPDTIGWLQENVRRDGCVLLGVHFDDVALPSLSSTTDTTTLDPQPMTAGIPCWQTVWSVFPFASATS